MWTGTGNGLPSMEERKMIMHMVLQPIGTKTSLFAALQIPVTSLSAVSAYKIVMEVIFMMNVLLNWTLTAIESGLPTMVEPGKIMHLKLQQMETTTSLFVVLQMLHSPHQAMHTSQHAEESMILPY